jgi:hypothetical protein
MARRHPPRDRRQDSHTKCRRPGPRANSVPSGGGGRRSPTPLPIQGPPLDRLISRRQHPQLRRENRAPPTVAANRSDDRLSFARANRAASRHAFDRFDDQAAGICGSVA